MPVVDAHCHASPLWYEPVETLLFQMERNGVDAAVLIQMQGQTDNAYQQECITTYPGRLASVVIVDHTLRDAPDQLRRLKDEGASGVRLRADVRSPGSDPLAIWRTAAELNMGVSCAGTSEEFASTEFNDLLRFVPSLNVVAEHMASVSRPDAGPDEHQRRLEALDALAQHPSVFIKVHGLGEIAPRAMPPRGPMPFQQPLPDYFQRVLSLFGPARMMWGSDFPPVAGREGYTNALQFSREQFSSVSAEGRDLIFGGTAARVFPIPA